VQEIGVADPIGTLAPKGKGIGIEEAGRIVQMVSSLKAGFGRVPLGASMAAVRTRVLDTIYPPRCLACPEYTDTPHGLCPACWRETVFVSGTACVKCGVPLMGEATAEDLCEPCQRHPPAWDFGAAALIYQGAGRRMVLQFKHGDRLDMVRPLSAWMAAAGARQIAAADIIVPVPLHWRRLLRRRYNQSAELARRLTHLSGKPAVVDLLSRQRQTTPQEGMDRSARAANQAGAFSVDPRRLAEVRGRKILLVDDVLTSGATLSNCAETLRAAGAVRIDVLVLARVAFTDSLPI
jgi:ComF family protein